MNAPVPKWLWIAIGSLVGLAIIPWLPLQLTIWAFLARPFSWLYAPPLVYRDKPWYVTYTGCIVTALLWSIGLLLAQWLSSRSKRKREGA